MSARAPTPRGPVTGAGAATGTIVLLTRLSRAVFLRSSVDLVGMNLRNMVTLAYLRDHPGVSQQTMTEDLAMDSNTGVLVLNDLEDLEYAERRRDPADRRRHLVEHHRRRRRGARARRVGAGEHRGRDPRRVEHHRSAPNCGGCW